MLLAPSWFWYLSLQLLAGRSILSTSTGSGYSMGISSQGAWAYSGALARKQVEGEGFMHCNAACTLRRWEYAVYMHRACEQGTCEV